MNDLITILTILRRHAGKLVSILVLFLAVFWVTSVGPLKFVEVSPDDSYRIEYYSPSIYQHLTSDAQFPMVLRLYRNTDNEFMGDSGPVDLSSGSRTLWAMEMSGEVLIGTDYIFEDVPPISPAGDILDYPKDQPPPRVVEP